MAALELQAVSVIGMENLEVYTYVYDDYSNAVVRAGIRKDGQYPVRVEVSVSPTGRSVQVWVNGERVK